MRKLAWAFLPLMLSVYSCAEVSETYKFTCTLNGNEFEADEIPSVTVSGGNMSVEAFFENSRFLLTTEGMGPTSYSVGVDTNATGTIVYWEDKDDLTGFFSSDSSNAAGTIVVTRLTSTSMEGIFSGTLHKTGQPDLVVANGEFHGKRP